jgi:spermidine synthase
MTVLYDSHSQRQHILLDRQQKYGLTLFLDNAVQFREHHEYRYHECLGVVPMLFCRPQNVFVGGGGDGLLASRLLHFRDIKNIVVCDYDQEVTRMAQNHPEMVALNSNSLSDPRVSVINRDAKDYLKNMDTVFDLIICDFPHPLTEELAQLYSQSFFNLVHRHLSQKGVLCVQTIPLDRPCRLIQNTLRSVFPHILYYRMYDREKGSNGFTLGSKSVLSRLRSVPKWTRYLDDKVVDSLFVIPKDERFKSQEINTVKNALLVRATLLDTFRDEISIPYVYNPNYNFLTLGLKSKCPPNLLPSFIRYMDEDKPLILYINRKARTDYDLLSKELGYSYQRSFTRINFQFTPENHHRLDEWWQRINNGAISKVDVYHCRSSDRPELRDLFLSYLDQYADRYFLVSQNFNVLNRKRIHLLARNQKGSVVMMLVISVNAGINIDIAFGQGSSREKMLGVIELVRLIGRNYGSRFTFDAATQNLVSFMMKLGAEVEGFYDLFTREAAH